MTTTKYLACQLAVDPPGGAAMMRQAQIASGSLQDQTTLIASVIADAPIPSGSFKASCKDGSFYAGTLRSTTDGPAVNIAAQKGGQVVNGAVTFGKPFSVAQP